MNCELVKMKVSYTDKKQVKRYFYSYYLVFENGTKTKVKPNVYPDEKGIMRDNRDILNALAREVSDYSEIVYVG